LKKGFLPLIENHDALQGVKDGSLQYAVGLAKGPPVGPLYGFMSIINPSPLYAQQLNNFMISEVKKYFLII
jgi:hypothetical protein